MALLSVALSTTRRTLSSQPTFTLKSIFARLWPVPVKCSTLLSESLNNKMDGHDDALSETGLPSALSSSSAEATELNTMNATAIAADGGRPKKVKSSSDGGKGKRDRNRGGRSNSRPNNFVAIQFSNPEIHQALRCVQEKLVEDNPSYQHVLTPIPKLHVTLFVLDLKNDDDIERAKEALDECGELLKPEINASSPFVLSVEGLSKFDEKVLYASLKTDDATAKLTEWVKQMRDIYVSHGLHITDDRFTAHITLAKVVYKQIRQFGIKKLPNTEVIREYMDKSFGCQTVQGIQLLSMTLPRDNRGYYHCRKSFLFDVPVMEDTDHSKCCAEWPSPKVLPSPKRSSQQSPKK